MGESIVEATVIKWHKQVGERIEQDETILEVATDKVDSEVPCPVAGVILEIKYREDDVVAIGDVLAIINTDGDDAVAEAIAPAEEIQIKIEAAAPAKVVEAELMQPFEKAQEPRSEVAPQNDHLKSDRFYSPLVRNIAKEEGIGWDELEKISGSGQDGRLTKNDLIAHLEQRPKSDPKPTAEAATKSQITQKPLPSYPLPGGEFELEQMDRMRKMIAEHMVASKAISPHVSSFVEADVTNLVKWRDKNKDLFQKKYNEKLTYTPIFFEAIVKALKDFPRVNCSVVDDKVYVFKDFNIGMATALPSGNLIVPVVKKAQQLSLEGLTAQINELAAKARDNKLKPDDVKDGTFTVTNIGTFGNILGTPIINQPQGAIIALGAIQKKPVVLETEAGDVIAIRHMMYLSMSYDHRFIDGFLGGSFLKRVGDYLEKFDTQRVI